MRRLRGLAKRVLRAIGRGLSMEGFAARVEVLSLPEILTLPSEVSATLRLTNIGSRPWTPRGLFPIRLGIHWRQVDQQDHDVFDDGRRTLLPAPVTPGESVTLPVRLVTPNTAGTYELTFDLVRENVGWFSAAGHSPGLVVREVEGCQPSDGDPGFDYQQVYARLDLDRDYWTIVGPASKAEFETLGRQKMESLIELGLNPDSAVLDVGCGTGQLAQPLLGYLSSRGRYVGTDLAEEAVAFCRRRWVRPNFRFVRNDMTRLPLDGELFDLIYLGSVFTHMFPEEVRAMLLDLRQRLTPQGAIVADAFISPAVQGHVGGRGMVVINEAYLAEVFASARLQTEVVRRWRWNRQTDRCIFRLRLDSSAQSRAA